MNNRRTRLRQVWLVCLAVLAIGGVSLPAHASHREASGPSDEEESRGGLDGALRDGDLGGALRDGASRLRPEGVEDTVRDTLDLADTVEDSVPEEIAPDEVADRVASTLESDEGESSAAEEPIPERAKRDPAPSTENDSPAPSAPAPSPASARGDVPTAGVPPASTGAGQQAGEGTGAASPRRRGAEAQGVTRRGARAARLAAVVGGASVSGGGVVLAQAPAAGDSGAGAPADEGGGAPAGDDEAASGGAQAPDSTEGQPSNTVEEIVEVVPDALWVALGLLAALSLLLGGGYLIAAHRARRLANRRQELLEEVGLLQTALLPPVPETVGAVRASVAYRPSDGPGAGGDFYDALTLSGGRAAFILGDVSGHGRQALAHTAFMRYTLRAYLGAGLEPRMALQVAERAVGGQLDGDFATVIVAVHEPADSSLTYASAGHPAPIIAGAPPHDPVLAGWSPPIGWGLRTGLRQTTISLPAGAIACLYTDGLSEATTVDGILGRPRLTEILAECGRDATATDVLDRVAKESVTLRDDMAACLIAPARHAKAGAARVEVLEVGTDEIDEGLVSAFLEECEVEPSTDIEAEVRALTESRGNALITVRSGAGGAHASVEPVSPDSIEAAAARRAMASRRG